MSEFPRPTESHAWLTILVPFLFLGAIAGGVLIIRSEPAWLLGTVLGLMLVTAICWIVISALWPAQADRTCPECGQETIERVDPEEVRGLTCSACDWEDPTASAWLLAEDEEPALEHLVQRRRPRG
jgi:hypothetical protein